MRNLEIEKLINSYLFVSENSAQNLKNQAIEKLLEAYLLQLSDEEKLEISIGVPSLSTREKCAELLNYLENSTLKKT